MACFRTFTFEPLLVASMILREESSLVHQEPRFQVVELLAEYNLVCSLAAGKELLSPDPPRTVASSKGSSASEDGGKDDLESTLSADPLLTQTGARLKPTEGPGGTRKC